MAERGTIFLEDAEVLDVEGWPGEQYIMRVVAPKCAAHARPGSFSHVACDPLLPMRRPLSLMRADPGSGVIEFLFKTVGEGLALLAQRRPGELVSVLGPIGRPFAPSPGRRRPLLIGGGVGIPPMVFLAESLAEGVRDGRAPLVLMGSEIPFPFTLAESRLAVDGLPQGVTAAMPLMETLGVASRLASGAPFDGCYRGFVTELARDWLRSLDESELRQVEIFACGPTPMLAATARLAREFGLPCQVSLEEFMACAVGGCAGCTVLVNTSAGPAMKRVCVDGPVFDAAVLDWG
ncbi:MAG TPA: dihydroorotate dehydrogenase electron transfer subunit [Gammaproteobacteria bacterium]|nr:dihydroorotate dehydrogenase electron transfer subunit [Gammaproteobacteria bacterium]